MTDGYSAEGYFASGAFGDCPKCGLVVWRPNWHRVIPCQQGCEEPWQWFRHRLSAGGWDKPIPEGTTEAGAVDARPGEEPDARRGGMEHIIWTSPCGYRRIEHTSDYVPPEGLPF